MVFVNNRGQTTHAPTSQHIEASKTCNSPNEINSDVNRKSTTSHNSLSESGQNDKNNNANIPIPNNPDHLVALHLVTTGVQGEDLGTDEKPVTWWTFLVLDVTKNKVRVFSFYEVMISMFQYIITHFVFIKSFHLQFVRSRLRKNSRFNENEVRS